MNAESNYKYVDAETNEIYPSAGAMYEAREARKAEKAASEAGRANPPFVQLYKGVTPTKIARVAQKSPTGVQILMFFFENMDDANVIMVSQDTIAETIGRTRKAVAGGLKALREENIVANGKVGTGNFYIVNPHIAWQKANKNKKNAVLKAKLILGDSEAEEIFKEFQTVFENQHTTADSNKDSLKMKGTTTKYIKASPQLLESMAKHRTDDFEYTPEQNFDEVPPEFEFEEDPEFDYED